MLIREIFSEAKVEMCPKACCGQPITECKCGPDCKHCDCYTKNKAMKEEHTGGATGVGSIAVGDLAANTAKRDKKGLPKAKQALNKDGTAKNGLDMGGSNLLGGKVAKR
jgi:hypothetical protein